MADGSDARLPREILEQADRIGIRTLGVPEEFAASSSTGQRGADLRLISEEIARATRGLPTSWCRSGRCRCLLRNIAPRSLQERWFPKLVADPAFLLAALPPEPVGLRIVAALQRARGRHEHQGGPEGRRVLIKAQAVHQQRL